MLSVLLATAALAACGGKAAENPAASGTAPAAGPSVCDQYEKAYADMLNSMDAAGKEAVQKAFEQTKAAIASLPADRREAACSESLKALKGETPAASSEAEEKAEAASEAKEEAKEAAEEAREKADEAKEEAKEKADEAKEEVKKAAEKAKQKAGEVKEEVKDAAEEIKADK